MLEIEFVLFHFYFWQLLRSVEIMKTQLIRITVSEIIKQK